MMAALGVGLLFGFVAGRHRLLRSNLGEALVANCLEGGLRRPYVLLNNITLEVEGGTTQIDHVLVMEGGIFVIESKHSSGWIFGGPKDRNWSQVIYNRKSRFLNPVRQNYGHLKAIQALFTLPPSAFQSVVLFTGDAEFKTDLGPEVIKLPQLLGRVGTERPVIFDERQMTYIVGRIEMKRLRRSIETDEYHLNYVRGHVKARLGRNETAFR